MNRKIMEGLSYGFYFIIICLIILVAYLLFFKENTPKKSDDNNDDSTEQIINENIKLNKDSINLDIGGSFDLKVTLIPSSGSEIIKYESLDEEIATVSESGTIKGLKSGQTTILVTVEGTELKSECTVIVSENVINAKELFVNEEVINMDLGETYQLSVSVVPNNAVDKSLIFSSTNEKVLSVDENGLVTGLRVGRAQIIVQSKANPEVQIKVTFFIQ